MPAFRLRRPWLHAALGLLPAAALIVPLPALAQGQTARVSVASDGNEADH